MEGGRTGCASADFCSDVMTSDIAQKFRTVTCPHERYPCGSSSPIVTLSLGQTVALKINKLFSPGDKCYYNFKASDKIDAEDLDPYNRKYIQIYVEKLTAMNGKIGVTSTTPD